MEPIGLQGRLRGFGRGGLGRDVSLDLHIESSVRTLSRRGRDTGTDLGAGFRYPSLVVAKVAKAELREQFCPSKAIFLSSDMTRSSSREGGRAGALGESAILSDILSAPGCHAEGARSVAKSPGEPTRLRGPQLCRQCGSRTLGW